MGLDMISITRQCDLLGLSRSSLYYVLKGISEEDLKLMRLLDEQYIRTPFYGYRRMTRWLDSLGYPVNKKKVLRLMRVMGLQAVYPKRKLSQPGQGHIIYPYLLRGVEIVYPGQVWGADITYIRMRKGFIYLAAVMDWYSRYVLSWEVSITLDTEFCVSALKKALDSSRPEIFNTDQGAQFTSKRFVDELKVHEIRISMDGRGRMADNIFVERLWRSLKYEEVYLRDYETVFEAVAGIGNYFRFYNEERFHQSLNYRTPAEVYFGKNRSMVRPRLA